jgi:uncharacterized membrane-anchored protein YhcB (DUF1043 family)
MEHLAEAQLVQFWKVGPVAVVMFIVIVAMGFVIRKLYVDKNLLQIRKDEELKELTAKKDVEIQSLNQYIRETHVEVMGLAQEFTSAVNHTPQIKFSPKRKKTTL